MDILDKYRYLWDKTLDLVPYTPYTPPPAAKRKYVPPKATPITIADQDMRSSNFITAHDLRDYRRTHFNLVLLPKVELPYDIIAKEVYGL